MSFATRLGLVVVALAALNTEALPSQESASLPFRVGERLVYEGRVRGISGRGTMWIQGPVEVRGTPTYELHFDFLARVGPLSVSQKSTSWLDPERMAAMRFEKRERHLLARRAESVELFPDERRWTSRNGEVGASPTSAPLDELSFIYFIRTLTLPADTTYAFDRHFDPARNPITIRVTGRETIATGAGEFRTVAIEMRVKDPQRYRGEGVIRIHFTDDHCRLPVRIESVLPIVGTTVLTLESYTHPPVYCATQAP